MTQNETAVELAQEVDETLAQVLPPSIAKLYAEYTRLSAGQESLSGWRRTEFSERLGDAARLIAAAFVLRRSGTSGWDRVLRRAGEVLEWLAHPYLNRDDLPIELLSAGCYQLAGYPARASGILELQTNSLDSIVLRAFLRSDFVSLGRHIAAYWSMARAGPGSSPPETEAGVSAWIADETVGAIGVVFANLRWGGDPREATALQKLHAIAQVLVTGSDAFSWILCRLVAETAERYTQTSLRKLLGPFHHEVSRVGQRAIERYVRVSFFEGKSLAWPSQARGLERLRGRSSCAIFTPTGSGKTTVAEVAILQSLFPVDEELAEAEDAPLVLYLTPSRALSAEIESKLASVFSQRASAPIRVTGLYGGTDWGPTDAWLTADERTVLVCTYEKAEALVRFLGPLFADRVRLVVVDEAHSIQLTSVADLASGDNRALRLESLGSRLQAFLPAETRFVAISAVATGLESALTAWITRGQDVQPVLSDYRSTRQLIGYVTVRPTGTFETRYDLLDGEWLRFEDESGQSDQPFVPQPFPRMSLPDGYEGPQKRLRPAVLWAAAHLAATDAQGRRGRSVLISMTQKLGDYAQSFIDLLEDDWASELPAFFVPPSDQTGQALWLNCLGSCADYFGEASREYRLLQRGIAVHHGNMPGLLARLVVEVVSARIVNIVLATSTLSEGVNLPFEIVLLPSLLRWDRDRNTSASLSVQEFKNLAGRAGRPGFGTEGQALVFLQPRGSGEGQLGRRDRAAYDTIVREIARPRAGPASPKSPLAALITSIREAWVRIVANPTEAAFAEWLEQVTPADLAEGQRSAAVEAVDSLDAFLVAALVEAEDAARTTSALDVEDVLRRLWRSTYAFYASNGEAALEAVFMRRGVAVNERIYPQSVERTRLYRTSLRPSDAQRVLEAAPAVLERLRHGQDYARWDAERQFQFIRDVVADVTHIPKFNRSSDQVGSGRLAPAWDAVLRWWLRAPKAPEPTPVQVADWHRYVRRNFGYQCNWGLGSVLGVWISERHSGELRSLSLDDWATGDLPWIASWFKELLTWGTLDPTAAYVLSRRLAFTRDDAEQLGIDFFESVGGDSDPLDPRAIRTWATDIRGVVSPVVRAPLRTIPVELLREFGRRRKRHRVIPVRRDGFIHWLDVAGFALARSPQPRRWQWGFRDTHDFILEPQSAVVRARRYY